MAAEAPRSSGPADSYIGSLISLVSKSEIRYEGVLFNINTTESSIGLRNVRSFGTEGRKKDGPQVPPGDRVYEYILFRGSDIKDLQVKSSPPVQTTESIYNDPAIIQSHNPQAATTSTSLPSAGPGSLQDLSSHPSQVGIPKSTFQGSLPIYQPSGSSGSWGSSLLPPTTDGSGLPMPTYWQGFYGASDGLQARQPSLLQPPHGLSVPPSMQQSMLYPAINASLPTGASSLPASQLPEFPPPLLPPFSTGTMNLHSSMLPLQYSAVASGSSGTLMSNKTAAQPLPPAALSTSLPLVSPLTTALDRSSIGPAVADKLKTVADSIMPYISVSEPETSIAGTSSSFLNEGSTPSLVTPDQLLHPGSTAASSSQFSHTAQKDVQVVRVSSPELPPPTLTEVQAPILPLPSPPDRKLSGAPPHARHDYRGGYERVRGNGLSGAPPHARHDYREGHERVRGNGASRPVTKFTEDFDFMAMNEKFNKDEVWGHLGKSNATQEDGYGSQDEDEAGPSKFQSKPVYVKDDFFDSLSCNAFDRGSQNGRTKLSEQRKIDVETFGDFTRYRGGHGGRWFGRGGHSRGAYYGRGYGYYGRGRWHRA